MNHLGVLLHGETQVLVLRCFFVEIDRWDGCDHFAKLRLILPAVGTALVSPAVGTALFSPSVGCALFTRCGSALSRCGCSSHPTRVRSFVFLSFDLPSRRRLLSLLTSRRCCCGLSITPFVTFSCIARSFTCCGWSGGTDQHHCSPPPRAAREGVCDLGAQLIWFASASFLALANGLSTTSIVLRVLCLDVWDVQSPLRLAMCLMSQWALLGTDTLVLIDQSTCLAEPRTRDRRIKCVPHGPLTCFLREPHRGVFAPRSLGTVLSLTLRDIGLLLDGLILSLHCQLGSSASRRHCGLVSLVTSASRISFCTGVQLFLRCMPFARQLRFRSSHLCLNLLNSGGPTSMQLRARSHASRRIDLPLLQSV